jgi:hypothetical protein
MNCCYIALLLVSLPCIITLLSSLLKETLVFYTGSVINYRFDKTLTERYGLAMSSYVIKSKINVSDSKNDSNKEAITQPTSNKPLNVRNNIHSHSLLPQAANAFQHSLSKVPFGGGEINEMFSVAKKCGDGKDSKLWYKSWDNLASKTFDDAHDRLETNPVAACFAFLRACNYFHTSSTFLRDHTDEESRKRVRNAYSCSELAFNMAIPNLPYAMKKYLIPYKSKIMKNTIKAYFFCTNQILHGFKSSPLIIATSGYYGDVAETFFLSHLVLYYGFNLLIYDGPGTVEENDNAIRSEWEKNSLKFVLDYVINQWVVRLNDGIICYGIDTSGASMMAHHAVSEVRPVAYIINPIVHGNSSIENANVVKPAELQKLKVPILICKNEKETKKSILDKWNAAMKHSIVGKDCRWIYVTRCELLWERYVDQLLPLLKQKIK